MPLRPRHKPRRRPPAGRRAAITIGGSGGRGNDNSELIANGAFASGAGWVLGAGWSIAGGVLTATAVAAAGSPSASTTFLSVQLEQGSTYRITYTMVTTVLGSVRFEFTGGATLSGATQTADGTFTQDVIATAAHTGFRFIAVSDYTGNIDNVSVRRLAS